MYKVDIMSCVSDPLLIEEDVFNLWLAGLTVDQAVDKRYKKDSSCSSFDRTIVALDTEDQYQTFSLLEPLLRKPPALASSPVVNMPFITDTLLQQYYSLDAVVARELVGRGQKMTAKLRKDLDIISDKTGIPMKSCLRQYDNIKRIYKEVDEKEGKVSQNIQRYYGLSPPLCQQYAAIIYIVDNRIDVAPRKIPNLTYTALVKCVVVLMSEWCPTSEGSSDMDIDRAFLKELHSLKDRVSDSMLVGMINHGSESLKNNPDYPKNFVSEVRKLAVKLMSIGYSLVHTKDYTDIFIDLDEMILCPWFNAGLSLSHLELGLSTLLGSYVTAAQNTGLYSTIPIFEKYLRCVTSCLLVLANR
ncbi:hypothetical protein ACHWQZ_G011629 [Mnemiopsis leidyi]